MPGKKRRNYGQTGPSLWDLLVVPQDLRRPLTDEEKYLFFDAIRGIKIPRLAHYYRLPPGDTPDMYRGRALRSQSDLLLRVGATAHDYAQAFVLFSGGNDSALAADFAMRFFGKNPQFGPAKLLHLDTGTGVDEAQEYVRGMAQQFNYPLEIYKTDVNYDDLVMQYGFPGGPAHRAMFGLLKKRPLRAAIRDHTYSEKQRVKAWIDILRLYCELVGFSPAAIDAFLRDYDLREKEVVELYIEILSHYHGTFAQQLFLLECLKREEAIFQREGQKKVLLVTGVRERESRRRLEIMRPLSREGQMVWLAPFFDWDASDVLDYLESSKVPTSPVYPFLHRSGECNCGAYAVEGELAFLQMFFPKRGNHIVELQDRVWRAGFHWTWESGPSAEYLARKKGQQYLEGFEPEAEEGAPNYLCSSCEYYHEMQQRQHQSDHPGPSPLAA